MPNIFHATFDRARDGIRAVEGILYHGARAQDISLILPLKEPCPAGHRVTEAVLDSEQGAGLGLGFGLLAAMCVPGIGMIAGSGVVVAGLMAAGTVAGGIAGGIYGHLIDCGVERRIAQVMSNHLEAGGTTLSVTVPDACEEPEIRRILKGCGGHLTWEE